MIERVIFVSRNTAENTPGWSDWAIISISDSCAALGDACLLPGWRAVYKCAFDDINPAGPKGDIEEFLIGISEQQARDIINFVREIAPQVQGVMVHCNSGVSRSAAVARWIAEEFNVPFNMRYDRYNPYVYQSLLKASKAAHSG